MYQPAAPEVLFGDILEAPYFFDVHLRDDAKRMARAEFPVKAKLDGEFYTDPQENLHLNTEAVLAYGRSGREKQGREHRDTYQLPGRAVLLSDDCHIPTAYGDRPDRSGARGRLLFAPIVPVDDEELQAVQEGTSYSRFALPAEDFLTEPSVAELKRAFQVHASAVDPNHRLGALDADGRLQLEQQWNAFICRRGPLASRENASKLGQLIAGSPELTQPQADAAERVWQTLDLGWELEGRVMRDASDAFENSDEAEPAVAEVVKTLRGIGALAEQAAAQLEALDD